MAPALPAPGSARCRFPTAPFRGAYQFCRCYSANRAYFTVWLSFYSASIRFRRTLEYGCGTAAGADNTE